jgi:poly(3-hydroxybutyrate) depolymerase
MPLLTNQPITMNRQRRYHIQVPDNPPSATVPAIIVFHGGGEDPATIAARWGVDPPNPVPANVQDYLLVFPAADEQLTDEWVHYHQRDSAFPVFDLLFVERLVREITTTPYATASTTVPTVSADPGLLYAAGFSNGAGMVWQLMNSRQVTTFQGFAAVAEALDPEKARHYREELRASGNPPPVPVPAIYIQGTFDSLFRSPQTLQEVPIDSTLPAFTVREMLDRNGVPAGPATTTLLAGSTNTTEVVTQLFLGTEAFQSVTVINGGHNWPGPTTSGHPPVATHYDATQAIIDFWRGNAGLP